MGFVYLALASLLLAAARFAFRPARTRRTWLVALVATELGHFWLWPALGVAALAARETLRGGDLFAGLATGVAMLAAAGFARPAWLAVRIARALPAQLTAAGWRSCHQIGDKEAVPLWSWLRLWRRPFAVRRVSVRSFELEGETTLRMDCYAPSGKTGTHPCVILVHGGGWDGGDRTELATFNHWLAAHGVAVVACDYRLAPDFRWPAQRDDVRAVLHWVRANATRLGVDPERLTLLGRSAGAQIATATAYGAPLPGVRAVVALYGVHNLEFVWSIRSTTDSLNSDKLMRQYLGGPPEGARAEDYRAGSAELLAHPDVPPTLIMHGVLDELVWCRHSEKLAAALARVGAPHVLVRLPWATHAGEANLHGPSGQLITGAVWRVATGA